MKFSKYRCFGRKKCFTLLQTGQIGGKRLGLLRKRSWTLPACFNQQLPDRRVATLGCVAKRPAGLSATNWWMCVMMPPWTAYVPAKSHHSLRQFQWGSLETEKTNATIFARKGKAGSTSSEQKTLWTAGEHGKLQPENKLVKIIKGESRMDNKPETNWEWRKLVKVRAFKAAEMVETMENRVT